MISFSHSRYPLLDGPTPLTRLTRMQQKLGHAHLFIKRDDHMHLALGGNKLRSLEFWVGAALKEGADTLIAAGDPNSNQCRLTAAAAAVAGLDCVIIHNGERNDWGLKASYPSRLLGADLRFVGPVDEDQRAAVVNETAVDLRKQGRKPYVIGDAALGALGYALAAAELHTQSQQAGYALRHVYLPGSMGPTEAGFIYGNALLGNPFEVHLVSVEYGRAELAARIKRIYDGLHKTTGQQAPELDMLPVRYHMDYLGDGYGVPTQRATQAIYALARTEAIFLEHTYTSKTFACMKDMAETGALPPTESMCFLHTGGTAALFSQFDLFEGSNRAG